MLIDKEEDVGDGSEEQTWTWGKSSTVIPGLKVVYGVLFTIHPVQTSISFLFSGKGCYDRIELR